MYGMIYDMRYGEIASIGLPPVRTAHNKETTLPTHTTRPRGGSNGRLGQWHWYRRGSFQARRFFCRSYSCIPDQPYDSGGTISKEGVDVDDLSGQAQLVRGALLSSLERNYLGKATIPVEGIRALLHPRLKDRSTSISSTATQV